MLMKDNKKNRATIIVASMKDKSGDQYRAKPQNEGAEVADADELYMIADDMMKSIEDRDIRSFKQSMEAFIRCCVDSEDSSEEYSEEREESEQESEE